MGVTYIKLKRTKKSKKAKCSLRKRYKRMYRSWADMRSRCNNSNHPAYKHYGDRGITVCEEWNNFENFFIWSMNNGYMDELTIDRIDVDGNYEPNNCRWTTRSMQNHNQRPKKHSTPFRGIYKHKKTNEYEIEMFGTRKKYRTKNLEKIISKRIELEKEYYGESSLEEQLNKTLEKIKKIIDIGTQI